MARINQYDRAGNIDQQAKKNILVLFEDNRLRTIKNILYQIRCNIFHGEKTPGGFNDDRIVKVARPVLQEINAYLIDELRIGD